MYRRDLEPILLDPSHSCTTNDVMLLPSTELMAHTLGTHHTYHMHIYKLHYKFNIISKYGTVDRRYTPFATRRQPNKESRRIGNNLLNEHLLVVFLAKRPCSG
jgi:hypothetical protein